MIALIQPVRSALAGLRRCALFGATLTAAAFCPSAQAAPYSQVIIFGDSLSDVGNFAHVTQSSYGFSYPGNQFNYSDHRFTNSSDTNPASQTYSGVWHEQLCRRFLGLPVATNSLDGGLDYAFGDAETLDGQRNVTLQSTPVGDLTLHIDNMGKQITDYLIRANNAADPNALYIVWGGANDLFENNTNDNVIATASRMGNLIVKLAQGGARNFIVPNLPPLGETPSYNTDPNQKAAYDAASASYRDQLNSILDARTADLQSQGINITLARLDVYGLFQKLLQGPAIYGFSNITNPQQGNAGNADQSLFWDTVHPTTAGHSQVAIAASDILSGGHPDFFKGEARLDGDFAYLKFTNGQEFGYYSYQFYPYLYKRDLGFEYAIPSTTGDEGIYLYDFSLQTFLFTAPTLWPYLYNFKENAFDYYFTGTSNPRVFYSFATNGYVYSN